MENFNVSDLNPTLQTKITRIRQWLFGWLVLALILGISGFYVQNNMDSVKRSFLARENRQTILFIYLHRALADSASTSVISKMFDVPIQQEASLFTSEQQAAFYENIRIPEIDASIQEDYLSGESNKFTSFYNSLTVLSYATIILALVYIILHFWIVQQLRKHNYKSIEGVIELNPIIYIFGGIVMLLSYAIMISSLPIATLTTILILLGGCAVMGMVMYFSASDRLILEFEDKKITYHLVKRQGKSL